MTINANGSEATHSAIFVHGFLDAGSIWNDVIALLDQSSIRTTIIDLPGMGPRWADTENLSLDHYASLVSNELTKSNLPVILIGQSMGAQVVELAAAAAVAKVAGIVLVTPVPLGGVQAPAEAVAPLKQLGGNPEAQRQVRASLSPALTEGQLDTLVEFGASVLPDTAIRLVDIWNDGDPAGLEPSIYKGPVAILSGGADGFCTPEMIAAIALRFAHGSVEVIEGAGHWLHLERPQHVADAIKAIAAGPADQNWQEAFEKKSATAFADAFAEDVQLEATVLYRPIKGRDNIKQVMEAASNIYEHLEFVAETTNGPSQYLQWEAKAFGGMDISGVTVITRNTENLIQHVAIHHRPLSAVLKFSTAIAERLSGVIDPSHFLDATNLPQSLRSQ